MILSGVMGAALRSPVVSAAAAVVNLLDNVTPTLESGTTSYNAGTHTLTVTGGGDFADWLGILSPSTTYTFTADYTMSSGSKLRAANSFSNSGNYWTSGVLSSSGSINVTFTTGAGVTNFFLQADTAVFTGTISNMVVHA